MEAEESFVKLLKLNHGFSYENRNFQPTPCPIADGGKLTLEKYTGDLLAYQRIQNDIIASETTWELFEKSYSALIDKSQKTQEMKSNFSENDVKLLIPILEVTYVTTSVQSISSGEFLFEKVLVGGALVIKNVSEYSDDSFNQLKARIAWAINEFRWGHKNLFKEAGELCWNHKNSSKKERIASIRNVFRATGELRWNHKNSSKKERIASIEDLTGNKLDDMKSLVRRDISFATSNYIQQLYEFETISVIAYEKVVPSCTRFDAKKQQEIDVTKSCPGYFDKRLVPDISIYHTEICMKDWLGSNNIYLQIPKWINQYQLDHGLVINSTVLIPSVKPAIELISEPSIFKFINSPKMLNISHVTTQKDLFYKTNYVDIFSNSQSLLDGIPFVDSTIDTSPANVIQCDIIYQLIQLTIVKDKIKISNQLETAVTEALKKDNPYQKLEEIFEEYGQVFCLSFVMGERLSKLNGFSYVEQESLTKITSNGFKEIKSCQNVFDEWKNFLSQINMDSTKFDIPNGNLTIDINDVNDFDPHLRTAPDNPNLWKIINRSQLIPTYKLLNDDLQKEIELLLSNEEQILMNGVSKLENDKIRYYNVNFGFHLKSDNYKVIGSIVSNNSKRSDLDIRFQLLTVSGFSIVIEEIDKKDMLKETADNDLTVHWLLIGNPLSVKYFNKKTRNMKILTGTISITLSDKQKIYMIDVKEEMDKVELSSLSPDCIIMHSFEFLLPNFNPKFQVTLKSWARTKIRLEITNHAFEEINSILEDETLGSLVQNSCNLAWYIVYSIETDNKSHQMPWEHLGYYLEKELQELYDPMRRVLSKIRSKGSRPLEKAMHDGSIGFYEYSSFGNIREIGRGNFGVVYSAKYNETKIALKDLNISEVSNDCVNELKQLCAIKFHPNINQFHGITQDPTTNKFLFVLQFANGRNLRQYLNKKWHENVYKISFEEIIQITRQITNGLGHLHKNNIIYCDLHSKNILVNDDKFLIASFGLSRKIDDTYNSSTSMIKGIPAYLDPHCHCEPGKKPDKKSDVYSLGVIFWELTSGVPPFASAINEFAIIIQTLKGYREQTIPGTPIDYAKLYKKCWNAEPNERPTISQIRDNLDLISETNTIKYITNCNKQLIPELDNSVHNEEDDLTKTLLKEAFVQKTRRPSCSSSKTSENSITKSSNGTSGRTLSFSSLWSSDSLTRPIKEHLFQRKLENAEELKSQGQIYYISGNYKESLKYLKNSLSIDPNDADALRFRGETYFKLKKYQKSLADFNKSIELEPNNAFALRSRGKTYCMINRYEESLADLTKSLEIDSDNAIALRTRGQTFYMLNSYENSLKDLTKSLEIDSDNVIALRSRGQTCYMLKRYEESCSDLTKSLDIDPDNSIAIRFLGQSCFELKKYEESSEHLAKALSIDPMDAVTLEFLGKSYFKQKKYKVSIEILKKSLKIDPKNVDALRTRGQAYCMLGDYGSSLEDLNSALKINPNDAESLMARGKSYYCLGKYKESLEDLNKSLMIEPNHPFALRTRGETHYMLKLYNESLTDLSKSMEFEPDNTFALKSRGQTYYALKLYEESLADLNKLNEIEPCNAVTLGFRGEIYYMLKRYDESLEDLTRSLNINPDNATALRFRGEVYYRLGQYDGAIIDLNESLRFDPKNAVTLRVLGQAYFGKEQYKESLENLNRSLKFDLKNAITLEYLGRTHYKFRNYEVSCENLTKSLNIKSDNNNALRIRGQAHYMLGNYEISLKDLDRALELDPNNSEALRARGKAYYCLKKYYKSLEDLTKSLDIEPDHPSALRSRGKTHYILENYEDSLKDLNKSLEIEIDNATALRFRGEIHYISERYDEAINDLTKSHRLDPKNAATLRALGQSYFRKEKYKESLENLGKSLKLDPKNAITLEFLGRTNYKLGNFEESRENLTKSLTIYSENNNALRTRGWAFYMLGNCENSLKDLDRALELNPNDAEALRARGKVYYSLKKYDESLKDLTKSLDIEPNHPFALRSRGTTWFMLNYYEESLADLNNSLNLEPDNVEALRSRAKTYAKLGRSEELQVDLDKILSIEEQKRKEDYLNSLKKSLNII